MKAAQNLFGIILFSVFAAVIAASTKKIFHLSPESGEKLVEGIIKCIAKLNFDPSLINLIKEGKYLEDERLIKAIICMNVDSGVGTADGRLNVDAVMERIFSNNAEIRKGLICCEKEYDGTPVGNLRGTLTCLKETLPFKIRM
ncbi:hypothetical protein O3G_MSEX004931 [Manduca sexta]|uniref:Uncharacterized protein n=1 Tax=Manduca sexta TaxID=7130 RepID=A0A921YX94_MANSE|nr:hypothetical protein O3G_MSEX004931 [Manduca sexta]